MENENVIVKQKSNKGVIIVLIILVLGLCSYIAYDKFVANNTKTTNTTTETTTKDETKITKDLYINDMVTYVNDGTYAFYGYIDNGYLLYKYGKSNDQYSPYTISDDNSYYIPDNNNLNKYDKLNNVVKIKVFNDVNNAVVPLIYLITSDGKVYNFLVGMIDQNVEFELNENLKDYTIDDILSIKPQNSMKVKLQDGTTKDIKIVQ